MFFFKNTVGNFDEKVCEVVRQHFAYISFQCTPDGFLRGVEKSDSGGQRQLSWRGVTVVGERIVRLTMLTTMVCSSVITVVAVVFFSTVCLVFAEAHTAMVSVTRLGVVVIYFFFR